MFPRGSWASGMASWHHWKYGRFLFEQGDARAALDQYDKGIETWGQPVGHRMISLIMQDQALAHLELGERGQARELLERSLAMQEKAVPADHPMRATALAALARLEREESRPDSACVLLERALAIDHATYGELHPEVAALRQRLAELELERGDFGAALAAALRAEDAGREHARLTAQGLPERRALALAGTRPAGLDVVLAAAVALSDTASARRAWDALVRSRGMVLNEMASRHRALHLGDDAVADSLWRELGRSRARLANLSVRSLEPPTEAAGASEDDARGEVERLRKTYRYALAEKEGLEQSLAERSLAFRRERELATAGYAGVVGDLPLDAGLVAFVRYEVPASAHVMEGARSAGPPAAVAPARGGIRAKGRYAAFVVRAGGAPSVVDLGDAARAEAAVSRWQTEVSEPGGRESACRRAGEVVRETLWDPAAARLGAVSRVYVVPDGALNLVSFAALPAKGSGYLIESGPSFHYLSGECDLARPRGDPAGAGLLALGDPAFDRRDANVMSGRDPPAYRGTRSSCRQFGAQRFSTLPATADEVREVSELWTGAGALRADVLLGPDATEAAFKAKSPGHRVLHLATHGFFLSGECRSALDRTRGIGGLAAAGPPVTEVGENPLLLSGLVLAGANHRDQAGPDEEDGILTAEEIASLDLSGVEWAVLSACETGVGAVRAGEGVFGLRRAFQVAGARTLIMSLWSVEDEATRAWMGHLYRARLEEGKDTAESVRAASLAVLAERRAKGESTHPFYWGAFVAVGDWR
jgi:CHAT domain-containing protein/tetratricopeptide (TPR) repeat protein